MRSLALSKARGFDDKGDENKARVAYALANAMLDDLKNVPVSPDDNFAVAYDVARSYSRAFNDTFTRAFANEATQEAPELLSKRLLQGGNDPTYLRVKQINEVGNFLAAEGIEGATETANTLRSTLNKILRNARAEVFDEATGEVSPQKLRTWMSQNKDVLDQFPALRDDLNDASKANLVLKADQRLNDERRAEELAQVSFYDLINPVMSDTGRRLYGTESPVSAIAKIFLPSQKAPERQLNRLLDIVNAVEDPAERQLALNGLKSSILEWANTKAGMSQSKSFSASTLFDAMFRNMKGKRISLMDWMLDNDVITEAESKSLRTYLKEMVRFEAAEASGNVGELVEKAGPIFDFYLTITGSAIGTRAQSVLTGGSAGPGAIAAAGRGAETMRKLFTDLPASLQTDIMSDMMRNPELLAAMMRKYSKDERPRGAAYLKDLFVRLGYRPARMAVPSLMRETDEAVERSTVEDVYKELGQDPKSLEKPEYPIWFGKTTNQINKSPVSAVTPPTPVTAPAPSPTNLLASAPLQPRPAIASAPQAPTDRARYAAFFPNDPASAMIRQQSANQGIGSLVG
jgi:hypothetical protein